ncbi:hypothetical protein GNP80_05540 [Aliivibrio fischeri]|uniref:hypothetical protein n=1 Tax=Aliivibrio fischeri TaxID=668 RepID=UPI0012D955A7|nr:hypothetical protein [Aliivibrio fischeri]MUK91898.1 hypothetical protein [Aliivibrio fischeri]
MTIQFEVIFFDGYSLSKLIVDVCHKDDLKAKLKQHDVLLSDVYSIVQTTIPLQKTA